MLTWPASVRVFVHTGPTDMRRSFDTLAAMVREVLREDPLSGHVFVFFNRPRDRAKLLLWDRTGYWLFYRRLESGVFRLRCGSGSPVEMTATELSLILEGIDLSQAERRQRFSLPSRTA